MKDCEAFELVCVDAHRAAHAGDTYHWKDIPEDLLVGSGWPGTDFAARRMKKLCRPPGVNPYAEFGLDGLNIDGDVFNALQFKYYTRTKLCEKQLGSFLLAVCTMRMRKPETKGHLYHVGYTVAGLGARLSEIGIASTTMPRLGAHAAVAPVAVPADDFDICDYDVFAGYKNGVKDAMFDTAPAADAQEAKVPCRDFVLRDYQAAAVERLCGGWDGGGLVDLPCGLGKTTIVAHALRHRNTLVSVVFCPLIEHCWQFHNSLFGVNALLVNNENTRCIDEIRDAIGGAAGGGKVVLVATFKSFDVIRYAFADRDAPFVVVDEVHKIPDEINAWVEGKTWVGLSGTPSDDQREALTTLAKMPLGEAISLRHVCDYEVIMPLVEDTTGEAAVWSREAAYYMSAALRTGCRKTIVYCRSVDECIAFKDYLTRYAKKFHGEQLWTALVVGDPKHCTAAERKQRKDAFSSCTDRFALLFSVHILNESIDIPMCDSVYLPQPAANFDDSSHMLMVQRAMRANRRVFSKGVDAHPNKLARIIIYAGEDHDVFDMFARLHSDDINFARKVRRITTDYDQSVAAANEEKAGTEVVQARVVALTGNELWMRHYANFVAYVAVNGMPKKNDKDLTWAVGRWCCKQRMYYGKNPVRDALLEQVSGWRWADTKSNIVHTWEEQLAHLASFVRENDRLPKYNEKIGDWSAGSWCKQQRSKRGKKPTRDTLLEQIPHWKWTANNDTRTWEEQATDLSKFVREQGRLPKKSEKSAGWAIGIWCRTQRVARGKIPTRDTQLEQIPGWVWKAK
jgi:superfamily II DNA or RNA helicase